MHKYSNFSKVEYFSFGNKSQDLVPLPLTHFPHFCVNTYGVLLYFICILVISGSDTIYKPQRKRGLRFSILRYPTYLKSYMKWLEMKGDQILHMWLEGCPNPYKMEKSWECTFLKLFTHTSTKLALKKFHHWTSELPASAHSQSSLDGPYPPCMLHS